MNALGESLRRQLAALDERYTRLEEEFATHAGSRDPKLYQQNARELSELRELVSLYRAFCRIEHDTREAETLARGQHDREMSEMASHEAASLHRQLEETGAAIERLWTERHAEPERPLIVEIRAGTGGLEASLFVGDLYRMYTKFAVKAGLTTELLSSSPSEAGGLKEVAFAVRGPGTWRSFKHESGVHRVQRVPATEAQGRIHTSTVTVAILPEPQDVELADIPAKDLQIDVYRSSGAGGQSVNTTDSAVRIRHLPTGLMVTCQDERSQLRNKERAMRVLRARLLDTMQHSQQQEMASARKLQVGGAERSEKIRTYNFPDRRITDHRAGVTLHQLDLAMEGELQPLLDALTAWDRRQVGG